MYLKSGFSMCSYLPVMETAIENSLVVHVDTVHRPCQGESKHAMPKWSAS